MAVLVHLKKLQEHPQHLWGELPVKDLEIDPKDDMIRLESPLNYDVTAQMMEDGILVMGRLEMEVECDCVRCLTPFRMMLRVSDWTTLVPLAGEEKATVTRDCVDLTPYMREDMVLGFPQHPICGSGCEGLSRQTADQETASNDGSGVGDGGDPSAWAELDKLKFED